MLSKYIRIFIGGLAIFMIVEAGALIYIDRGFLKESDSFQVQKIQNNVSSSNASIKVRFSSSAEDAKASYDGKFLAYTDDDQLNILNMSTGKQTKISMDEDMELDYYKWLYDRDQLIIAETNTGGKSYYAKLYNLNAKELSGSNAAQEIRNTVDNQPAKITLKSKYSHITDMDFSTSTVMTYLKITEKGDSTIWKFNIPDENKAFTSLKTKDIGNIQCLKNESVVLYEDKENGKIYIAGGSNIKSDGQEKLALIGFDNDDKLYLAENDGSGSTKTLLYGSILKQGDDGDSTVDTTPELTKLSLDNTVKIKNIHITLKGGIFEQDVQNHTFKNLITNKETSYSGDVLTFYGSGFITLKDGIVHAVKLD